MTSTTDLELPTEEVITDYIGGSLLSRIAATFGLPIPADGTPLPHLWHWCFFQRPVWEEDLGADGHPIRNTHITPVPGRSRMWAGGRVEFLNPILVGSRASRQSRITGIKETSGSTGTLTFYKVEHLISQGGKICIREQQDIVYKDLTKPRLSGPLPAQNPQWSESITASSIQLFRYSAVTFNSHKIHYDHPYASNHESYPELVVHGPLIATLNLAAFVKTHPTAKVDSFQFRGLRPLFSGSRFRVEGCVTGIGEAKLWATSAEGEAQSAELTFT
ncbi:MaoC family dehydratase N-terminal domain-containing protein [Pseudomonas sp. TWI929]|uniref:FAS1-like dehydratase domain-containing protein n=1 Tax=Pseudomonas sp. TWI929 TaxID=3136795 RepID=UPI00320807FD